MPSLRERRWFLATRSRYLFSVSGPFSWAWWKSFLAEEHHFFLFVIIIELDEVKQGLGLARLEALKIQVEVGLELVKHGFLLGVVELAVGRDVGGIDEDRALGLHGF